MREKQKHTHKQIKIIKKKQGELVDRIEHHVESSGGYIGSAREELTKAHEYQTKARKVQTNKITIINFICHLFVFSLIHLLKGQNKVLI